MTSHVPAGAESWLCQVSKLPFAGVMNVNLVESVQTPGVHHMDVMALTPAGVALETGVYDCNQLYRDYPQIMEDGLTLYAAQDATQRVQLPSGVVATLPGGILVMQELHLLNASPTPLDAFSKVNIYSYDGPTTQQIWGGTVRDTNLTIPHGEHVEWSRCIMNTEIDVLFLSSHTHALGRKVEIRRFDGKDVGALVYQNTDWHTPALLSFGNTPLHVAAGQGFEFSCFYENPTAQVVHWGFHASDEMCQMAMVFTPGEPSRKCQIVQASN